MHFFSFKFVGSATDKSFSFLSSNLFHSRDIQISKFPIFLILFYFSLCNSFISSIFWISQLLCRTKNNARINGLVFFCKCRWNTKCAQFSHASISASQRDYSSLATAYKQVNSANVHIYRNDERADRERGQMYISLEEETRSTDNAIFFSRASQTEFFALTDDESFDVRTRPASYPQRCVAGALCLS